MKKIRPKPRPNRSRNGEQSNGERTLPRRTSTAEPKRPWRKSRAAWRGWEVFWAFVGPPIAIVGLWFLIAPNIEVSPSVNLDPTHLYSTQFLVRNSGHIPVYDVHFGCGIGIGGGETMLNGVLANPDIRTAAVLNAGQSITRSCDVGDIDVEGNRSIALETTFSWPVIGWREKQTTVFGVRKGVSGYFLVPDLPP